MFKWLAISSVLISFLMLFLTSCRHRPNGALDRSLLTRQLVKISVTLEEEKERREGVGFLISETEIVSNRSLIRFGTNIDAAINGKGFSCTKVTASFESEDISVIGIGKADIQESVVALSSSSYLSVTLPTSL